MAAQTVLVIDDSPTILKVVQLVLSKAGFSIETAADGESGLELARRRRPDLILLDFVMPKMNGYQVCRAMASEEVLKDIPVVLMSAKGDQVGERFIKVMGIVDYITKPFSPEAITAVVQHSVAKYSTLSADDYAGEILAAPAVDESPEAAPGDRQSDLKRFRESLAESLCAELAASDAAADPGEGTEGGAERRLRALREAVHAHLSDSALSLLAAPLRVDAGGASLRGDVRVVPIADVLQLLDAQSQTGVLEIARGQGVIEISFRDGQIDLAMARELANEFLLGRFIVEAELMKEEDFDSFLETRRRDSKLIGSQLVDLGYVSESELVSVLQQQTRELVYELLRWNFGSFSFTRTSDLPTAAADAMLGLTVEGILMEGFRRVDEWHLIEREISDFDSVFLRNEDAVGQMGRGRLTREELTVLELVNGKNSVKDLIRESRMGSFEVSKMLYRLLSIKLVRRRVLPVAV